MKLYTSALIGIFFLSSFVSCNKKEDNQDLNTSAVYPQYGVPFSTMPKREDAIIYQINVRAFSDAGTLKGVQEKLSSIQELGVNVIYLMPIYPVGVERSAGGLGSPYSVKDYKAVNPEFGTLQDLQVLVEEAHKKNIAVILDWVANHTAWDNAWIKSHPEYYQKDDKDNIIIPPGTNYNDVAQLNFNNKDMTNAMIDAMSYWVYTANIDGFRCDYADAVPQGFWSQAISSLRKIKNQDLLMLAEGSKPVHFVEGFDYTFGFEYFGALKKVFAQNKPTTIVQDANATEYTTNYNNSQRIVRYTTNHDVNISYGTPLELFGGKKGSIATFVVACYMKSVPMIYNGQEIGYNKRIKFFTHEPIDWTTADANMLAEYKKIIAFRNASNAIKRGVYKGYSSDAVSVFTMETDAEKVLVLSNLTNATTNYIFPNSLTATAWKDAFTEVETPLASQIKLLPYEYLVLRSK
jgi:glycosidase